MLAFRLLTLEAFCEPFPPSELSVPLSNGRDSTTPTYGCDEQSWASQHPVEGDFYIILPIRKLT